MYFNIDITDKRGIIIWIISENIFYAYVYG